MKNTMNISATLQDCLSYNNRFATVKLTAEQLGAENFKNWTALIKPLHKAAYEVYEYCENNGLKVSDPSVDKSAIYDSFRKILAEVGEVNGHKMYANESTAILLAGYAGRRANSNSPELQLCLSKKSNAEKLLKEYSKYQGVNPETIKKLEEEIAELDAEKAALLAEPDNRIKVPTRTSENAFRLEVEHLIARAIDNQNAKTWDELEAEDAARKEARRKQAKANKQAKKNANK